MVELLTDMRFDFSSFSISEMYGQIKNAVTNASMVHPTAITVTIFLPNLLPSSILFMDEKDLCLNKKQREFDKLGKLFSVQSLTPYYKITCSWTNGELIYMNSGTGETGLMR